MCPDVLHIMCFSCTVHWPTCVSHQLLAVKYIEEGETCCMCCIQAQTTPPACNLEGATVFDLHHTKDRVNHDLYTSDGDHEFIANQWLAARVTG